MLILAYDIRTLLFLLYLFLALRLLSRKSAFQQPANGVGWYVNQMWREFFFVFLHWKDCSYYVTCHENAFAVTLFDFQE